MKRQLALRLSTALALLLSAAPAGAQFGSGDGFLFRVPTWRVSMSGGYAQPGARSDIFEFLTEELTLDRGDFTTGVFTLAAAGRLTPRVELGASASFAGRESPSESRNFVGEDDLPIRQQTRLDRSILLATARISLVQPGRSIGRFVWIPTKVVPYVGGGAGAVWYRLRQEGEFVDRETLDIFADQFESTAWAPGAAALGGADISLTPRFGLSMEGRYLWSKGPMRGDFNTFNKIDLSGYDASVGVFVRF